MIESGNERVFPATLTARIAGGILLGGESRMATREAIVDLRWYYALVDHRSQCSRQRRSLALPHLEETP